MKMNVTRTLCLLSLVITISSCKKEEVNKVPVANAGNAQTIQAPAESVTLTGTGTDADGQITGYLWSQITGPNNATIVHPGSASTLVKGLISGSYLFQLMVVDNEGATGLDTVSVRVLPAVIKTLNLQPANNPTEVHVLGGSNQDHGHAGAPELGASGWTWGGTPVTVRGFFKFDLSSIPANATIHSAKLSLYSNPTPVNGDQVNANSGSNNAMWIQRIVAPWVASTTKWSNQPATTTTAQINIPHTNQSFLDLVDVDVTDMVKAMVNNNANYGFMIRLQTESYYNSRIFGSSFYSNASKHPKIVVQYQ